MEAPIFDQIAAYSTFSNGPNKPVSQNGGNIDDKCTHEIQVEGPNRGLRYICTALLHKKFGISYYKPCEFANGKCPFNRFLKTQKPVDTPLEIEAKWKQNNGKA